MLSGLQAELRLCEIDGHSGLLATQLELSKRWSILAIFISRFLDARISFFSLESLGLS